MNILKKAKGFRFQDEVCRFKPKLLVKCPLNEQATFQKKVTELMAHAQSKEKMDRNDPFYTNWLFNSIEIDGGSFALQAFSHYRNLLIKVNGEYPTAEQYSLCFRALGEKKKNLGIEHIYNDLMLNVETKDLIKSSFPLQVSILCALVNTQLLAKFREFHEFVLKTNGINNIHEKDPEAFKSVAKLVCKYFSKEFYRDFVKDAVDSTVDFSDPTCMKARMSTKYMLRSCNDDVEAAMLVKFEKACDLMDPSVMFHAFYETSPEVHEGWKREIERHGSIRRNLVPYGVLKALIRCYERVLSSIHSIMKKNTELSMEEALEQVRLHNLNRRNLSTQEIPYDEEKDKHFFNPAIFKSISGYNLRDNPFLPYSMFHTPVFTASNPVPRSRNNISPYKMCLGPGTLIIFEDEYFSVPILSPAQATLFVDFLGRHKDPRSIESLNNFMKAFGPLAEVEVNIFNSYLEALCRKGQFDLAVEKMMQFNWPKPGKIDVRRKPLMTLTMMLQRSSMTPERKCALLRTLDKYFPDIDKQHFGRVSKPNHLQWVTGAHKYAV